MWRVRRKNIMMLFMREKIWLGIDSRVGVCVRGVGIRVVVVVVVWYSWCDHDGDVFGKRNGGPRRGGRVERWGGGGGGGRTYWDGQRRRKRKKKKSLHSQCCWCEMGAI